jgi:hypothetical protein
MRNAKFAGLLVLSLFLAACGSTPSWEGFSPVEAENLQALGLSAGEAGKYREMGFNSDTVKRWFDAGFKDRNTITAWHDAGYHAEAAGDWHRAKFNLEDASKWQNSGFSAVDAEDWHNKGFSIKEAKKLRERGLSAE